MNINIQNESLNDNQIEKAKDFIEFMIRTESLFRDFHWSSCTDPSMTDFHEKLDPSELENFNKFGEYEIFDEVTNLDEYSFEVVEKSICIFLKELNIYIEELRTIPMVESFEAESIEYYVVQPIKTNIIFGKRQRISNGI